MIANCTRVGWYTELRNARSCSRNVHIDEWELSRSSACFLDVVIVTTLRALTPMPALGLKMEGNELGFTT